MGARSGVIEKQQPCMVTATLHCLPVRGSQQRVHFGLVQVRNHSLCRLLKGNRANLSTPGDVLRTVLRHKSSQSVNRSQTLVARGDRTFSGLLQVGQKEAHKIGGHVDHCQPVHGVVQFVGNKRNQQNQSVPVAALSVASQVALSYQVLEKKPPHPGSQQRSIIHAAPQMRIAQSAGWLRAAVPVSWSDSAGWPRYGYGRDKLPVAEAAVVRLLPGDTRKSSDVQRRRGAGHAV